MNSGNTTATVTLAANPIVEKCLLKLATEVTDQIRDKLVDIMLAVLSRECEDFDAESVRRHIIAEIKATPLVFELEKRVAAPKTSKTPKTPKTKVVDVDADGLPVKKVRAPKEPKEPKAPKELKPVVSDEEREAVKAAKQAEKEAVKAAKQAEKAAKEAGKAAKEAEKEAGKAAKEAEKEAAKAAKQAAKAEKEAAKAASMLAKPAKEQRLPIPWCGARIPNRCEALRAYHGLFAQCTSDATEISAFCPSCEKSNAPFGTCAMRSACGLFDYTDPKGKKCVRLANVVDKFEVEGGIDAFIAEAAKHGIEIPAEHLAKEVKARGRPKSSSPRARPATKIATSDTGSGSETETEDEDHQAKKQQRKKVTKTAAADTDAAPKKRGRPTKPKEAAPAPVDDLIQSLVASAKKSSTPVAAAATPTSPELSEDEQQSPVVVVAAAPKPKVTVKPKPAKAERKVVEVDGENFWVEQYNSAKIIVRCEDNMAFDASTGDHLGEWDNKQKTVIECAEESDEE
jgi:outer membrane biosynthesis protein TonB